MSSSKQSRVRSKDPEAAMIADADSRLHVEREIALQPDAWRKAAAVAATRADVLPQPGESVAVVGCGTSWHVAIAYAALREEAGAGRTDAYPASELRPSRRYDRVLVVSRSGTTTEVMDVLASCRDPQTVITSVAGSPVTERATHSVVLDFADERSVVQTLFATSTLMLLRAGLGGRIDAIADQAAAVLDAPDPAWISQCEEVTFLGQGWAYGVALEAALKLRESAQFWSEAYLQMEYRHGPISIAEPGRLVWIIGRPVHGILTDIERTGATVIDDDLDPVVDLVRAQRFAVDLAKARGLNADRPRHLSRSVVLVESSLRDAD
jgi:fructoselysine-6-P-deglycase FrlB-like protein